MGIDSPKPRMLLHSCCGPCSTAVIERLENEFDLTIFFYNPNITDEIEYDKRKASQMAFIALYRTSGSIEFIEGDYEPDLFLAATAGMENEPEGGGRCAACFRLRLVKTAVRAKRDGFEYFGTTLTVSPHKNAAIINEIGHELGEIHGVRYYASDFKKQDGFRRSVNLANQYGLYRQNYCGCLYSKNK